MITDGEKCHYIALKSSHTDDGEAHLDYLEE